MPRQLLCYRFMTYRNAHAETCGFLDWLAQRGGLTQGDPSSGYIWVWVPINHEVAVLNLWGTKLERCVDRDL